MDGKGTLNVAYRHCIPGRGGCPPSEMFGSQLKFLKESFEMYIF